MVRKKIDAVVTRACLGRSLGSSNLQVQVENNIQKNWNSDASDESPKFCQSRSRVCHPISVCDPKRTQGRYTNSYNSQASDPAPPSVG
jgi:hypothetical protein